MSNYVSFGGLKFIPEISPEAFVGILKSNHLYASCDHYKQVIDELYPLVEQEIFAIEKPYTQINFPDEGGTTAYFSSNMTKEDLKLVKRFLDSKKINVLNTRAFKKDDFYVTVASINSSSQECEFEGQRFVLQHGEFGSYLTEAVAYLKEALKYCANSTQEIMV